MPWQDIHAKIEGPAARDIMMNFVERWVRLYDGRHIGNAQNKGPMLKTKIAVYIYALLALRMLIGYVITFNQSD